MVHYFENTPERLLIFTHIPKTAGSTLTSIFQSVYKPHEVAKFRVGSDREEFMATLSPRVRLVTGHCPHGLHRLTARPCTYFTMLRDPVERVISLYYYLRRASDHAAYARVVSGEESFEAVVRGQRDIQTVFLAGAGSPEPGERLKRARQNLAETYLVCGLSEQFDESLLLMQSAFGWKATTYRRQNVTSGRPLLTDLPPDLQRVLAQCNSEDQVLYEDAQRAFHRQLAVQPAGFQARVHRLRIRVERTSRFYLMVRAACLRAAGVLQQQPISRLVSSRMHDRLAAFMREGQAS